MPLQNRVTPYGELIAVPARGTFFGNRGGRFHTDAKTLTARRWASRQWICCVLDFKGRRRDIWGLSYTELFFLEEPTAFAAGHRPCFECRPKDAEAFAESGARRADLAGHHARGDGRGAARRTLSRTRETPAPAPAAKITGTAGHNSARERITNSSADDPRANSTPMGRSRNLSRR
jgi:hypothetical protein